MGASPQAPHEGRATVTRRVETPLFPEEEP